MKNQVVRKITDRLCSFSFPKRSFGFYMQGDSWFNIFFFHFSVAILIVILLSSGTDYCNELVDDFLKSAAGIEKMTPKTYLLHIDLLINFQCS